MVKLNEFDRRLLIEKKLNEQTLEGSQREYLGMSSLGHECSRYLWFTFRWYYKEVISARMRRLFDRGHREEASVIAELKKIDVMIEGMQQGFVGVWGHVRGHCDGLAINVPDAPKTKHILEIKTMNDKAFKDISKSDVKSSKPVYFAQMQLYMYFSELKRALFIAVNKNDDNWYVERVKLDKGYAEDLLRKAEEIILSPEPMKRTLPVGWYACRWCAAQDVCERGMPPAKSCRSCEYVSPMLDGKWHCNFHEKDLWLAAQRTGCDEYSQI